jgi:hypothetical protein
MQEGWRTTIQVSYREVKLLVSDELGDELLRARLPAKADHPRSLLSLLEGLALWSGSPVTAAISVVGPARFSCDKDLFGGALLPADSALVRLVFVDRRRPRRLRGLGSFRDVLAIHGEVTR